MGILCAAEGKLASCSPPGSAADRRTCCEGPQSIKGLSVELLTEEINGHHHAKEVKHVLLSQKFYRRAQTIVRKHCQSEFYQ